ncbi:MAG: hypothetical protein QXT69_02375 [Fervidicoccaceae archaeon]
MKTARHTIPSEGFRGEVSPKIAIIMDWSEASSQALMTVLEAKKKLLISYLIDVEVESTYINLSAGSFPLTSEIPSIYVNGRLIASGKPPSEEDILQAVLGMDEAMSDPNEFIISQIKDSEPPMSSAAHVEIEI